MPVPRLAMQVLLTLLISPMLCLAQSEPLEKATASGRVLLAPDSRPVRHARVEFLSPSTGSAASTLTDTDGKFRVTDLSPTTYEVVVTAPACEKFDGMVKVERSAALLILHLHETGRPPTPMNDSVVSAQELKMSDRAEPLFAKGTKLLQKGEFRQSVRYLQRAIAKDPGYYRAYHNLGLAYYQLREVTEAQQAFQKSIDLSNGGYAPSQFAFAMILSEKHEFQQAERMLQNALEMEPGSALGKYFLGVVQLALNRPAEADKSARAALWRNANQAEAHILLAKIHEREHNPYGVLTEVAAYLQIDPHGPLESEANILLTRAQLEINGKAVANH